MSTLMGGTAGGSQEKMEFLGCTCLLASGRTMAFEPKASVHCHSFGH